MTTPTAGALARRAAGRAAALEAEKAAALEQYGRDAEVNRAVRAVRNLRQDLGRDDAGAEYARRLAGLAAALRCQALAPESLDLRPEGDLEDGAVPFWGLACSGGLDELAAQAALAFDARDGGEAADVLLDWLPRAVLRALQPRPERKPEPEPAAPAPAPAKRRPPRVWTDGKVADLLRLHRGGAKLSVIARRLSVSESAVKAQMHRLRGG